jgi:hypothetical protein
MLDTQFHLRSCVNTTVETGMNAAAAKTALADVSNGHPVCEPAVGTGLPLPWVWRGNGMKLTTRLH